MWYKRSSVNSEKPGITGKVWSIRQSGRLGLMRRRSEWRSEVLERSLSVDECGQFKRPPEDGHVFASGCVKVRRQTWNAGSSVWFDGHGCLCVCVCGCCFFCCFYFWFVDRVCVNVWWCETLRLLWVIHQQQWKHRNCMKTLISLFFYFFLLTNIVGIRSYLLCCMCHWCRNMNCVA